MSAVAADPALPFAAGDAHLREDTLASDVVYRGRFLEIRQDRVRLPDGTEAQREHVVHPGAVMIVPVLDDGRLVVERQWRHPLGRALIEFPAGKLDPGEDPWLCGRRELLEETGYRAAEWARAGLLNNAIAYSNEGIEIWFARGLRLGERRLDAGEFLDVGTTTLDDLDRLAEQGALTDAKTLIGMLWLHKWRTGRWSLSWRPDPGDSPPR